ncbi:MAG: hypothetical protein AUK47_26195 [Deltaproteobacteria bacterium CG2_30_63_29]|nr:MAG: hypothetical protein AUK47_26195 [Deltaproteobacteria bacterium CG2_30_63_29]PJB35546.1 MAG: hypothetical protein CO108_25345 [Deltaproteobacteria bacterium CG_4_9_14_3_um_filter_63_12]
MKTYQAGQNVPYGVYTSMRPLNLHYMSDSETLPGTGEYTRIPTWLMVVASPAIGGLFVMAFPFICLVAVAAALGKLAANTVHSMATRNAHLVQMNWEPGAAYLDGKGQSATPTSDDDDLDLEALKAEVAKKREAERL